MCDETIIEGEINKKHSFRILSPTSQSLAVWQKKRVMDDMALAYVTAMTYQILLFIVEIIIINWTMTLKK